MKQPFITTPMGSYVKVFLALLINNIISHPEELFVKNDKIIMNWVVLICTALLPMLTNAASPQFPLYGKQPKNDIVVDNPNT